MTLVSSLSNQYKSQSKTAVKKKNKIPFSGTNDMPIFLPQKQSHQKWRKKQGGTVLWITAPKLHLTEPASFWPHEVFHQENCKHENPPEVFNYFLNWYSRLSLDLVKCSVSWRDCHLQQLYFHHFWCHFFSLYTINSTDCVPAKVIAESWGCSNIAKKKKVQQSQTVKQSFSLKTNQNSNQTRIDSTHCKENQWVHTTTASNVGQS